MPEPTAKRLAVALPLTVRFAETDAMGIVHHSNYVVWFEAGRIAFLEAVGYPYPQLAARGFAFAVTDLHIRYRSAARFGGQVIVHSELVEVRSRGCRFHYQVRQADTDTLLAEGETAHICVDRDGRARCMPTELQSLLQSSAVRIGS